MVEGTIVETATFIVVCILLGMQLGELLVKWKG